MALTFRYRYVDFGTVFAGDPRLRGWEHMLEAPGTLFANELVTDVGGTCWGSNEPLAILDHHFPRPGQFPSASAAVLHKAQLIRDRFVHSAGDLLWLVTHTKPDFDAFCSLYLARWTLEEANTFVDWQSYGLHPEGWLDLPDRPKIDWFNPDLGPIPLEHRWPLLLASYASLLDNRRRISCPRRRTLDSYLQAALLRGRDYLSQTSGATEFFEEVRALMLQEGFNPIFDSVLEQSVHFAPERAMLDTEAEAYERDIARARKSIVYLPQAEAPSPKFFKSPKEIARLELQGNLPEINAEQLRLADTFRIPTSGVYLRDPECRLFQPWARLDLDHSPLDAGFEFTALAYSNARPAGAINKTDYVFSIDPERANGRHLYTVWTRLQTKRMEALQTEAQLGQRVPPAAVERLGDEPWFGGPNSDGTLVRSPSHGTAIGPPGTRPDLRDDPVVEEVRTELELPIYAAQSLAAGPQVRIIDLAGAKDCEDGAPRSWNLSTPQEIPSPREGYFRFAAARLRADVPLAAANSESRRLAEQIGDTLWQVLYPEQPGALPEDFIQRHLVVTPAEVAVWGLRGIAVAQKFPLRRDATSLPHREVTAMQGDFASLVSLVRGIDQLAADSKDTVLTSATSVAGNSSRSTSAGSLQAIVARGEELTRRATQLQHMLTLPDRDLLRRFSEAIGLGQLLATLRDLHHSAAENLRRHELAAQVSRIEDQGDVIAKLRSRLEWLEVFILVLLVPRAAEMITNLYGGGSFRSRTSAYLSGALIAGLGAWLLKPWRRKSEVSAQADATSRSILVGLIAACVALWLLGMLRIGNQ